MPLPFLSIGTSPYVPRFCNNRGCVMQVRRNERIVEKEQVVETVVVDRTEVVTYQVELTEEEAEVLFHVVGKSSYSGGRGITNKLYDALKYEGVTWSDTIDGRKFSGKWF